MLDMLKGVKVVSFNHFLMGPMGIQHLGDLGADVVSIETPEGAYQRHWSAGNIWCDGQSVLHLCANRNKRNLALDLKSEKGKEIALRLIDGADIVAENFRPGVMEKLGFGYEALKARKPSLIYASASGYGPDGPYKERPGQDLLAQALFGLMAITGQHASGPRPVGVSAVDHHGAMVFAMGVLAALVRRGRTGQGCRVDVSLMQAALDLQAESLVGWLNSEKKPDERSPRHIAAWYYSAPYGVYATRNGHLAISITPLKLLSEALEDPRLLRFTLEETWDPARKEAICDLIAETIRTRETDHWISRMQPLKIWHARVQGYADIVADPQVQHMKCIVTAPGAGKDGKPVTLVNHPVRYDGQAAEVHLPPQPLGGQTEDVLAELGFGAAEIEALERDGVVRRAQ